MKKLQILFIVLFIAGLCMEIPMAWFIWTGGTWTPMAQISVETSTVTYNFLPIVLHGEKAYLSMFILYVPFPTAISFIGYLICSKKIKDRKNYSWNTMSI